MYDIHNIWRSEGEIAYQEVSPSRGVTVQFASGTKGPYTHTIYIHLCILYYNTRVHALPKVGVYKYILYNYYHYYRHRRVCTALYHTYKERPFGDNILFNFYEVNTSHKQHKPLIVWINSINQDRFGPKYIRNRP